MCSHQVRRPLGCSRVIHVKKWLVVTMRAEDVVLEAVASEAILEVAFLEVAEDPVFPDEQKMKQHQWKTE